MASFNYARAKATADRLISKFGKKTPCFLIKPGETTGPAYDPVEGEPVLYKVTCVVLNYMAREIDGARILATDKHVYCSLGANKIVPTLEWKLLIDNVTYQLVSPLKPLQPGDICVLWEFQCRSA